MFSLDLISRPWFESSGLIGRAAHSVKRALAFRSLQRQMDHLVAVAEDHKAFGLPNAHDRFKELFKQANQEVDCYCIAWQQDRNRLIAELPNISRLEQFAQKNSTSPITIVLAACLAAVALGAVSGLVHVAYCVVSRLGQ